MEKMNHAFEKTEMMVGIEDEDEELQQESSVIADVDRKCTISIKQEVLKAHDGASKRSTQLDLAKIARHFKRKSTFN